MINDIKSIISFLPRAIKFRLLITIALTICCALFEVISLGSVIPFVGIVLTPEVASEVSLFGLEVYLPHFAKASDSKLFIIILFIIAAISAGLFRILLLWIGIQVSNTSGAFLSAQIFEKNLYKNFVYHSKLNSSEIVSAISQKIVVVISILQSVITILTSSVIGGAIVAILLYVNFVPSMLVLTFFALTYAFVLFFLKSKMQRNGMLIASRQTLSTKILQEALMGVRELTMSGQRHREVQNYKKVMEVLQKAIGENQFYTLGPRYLLECFALVTLGIFSLVAVGVELDINKTLPYLALLAVAGQKILPLFQQIYGCLSYFRGGEAALNDVANLLSEKTITSDGNVVLEKIDSIIFDDVQFQYPSPKELILDDIKFEINGGDKVALVGNTGSGKSTLIDLLLGLLSPSKGRIMVNSCDLTNLKMEKFYSLISHVPQTVFLLDGTIKENIVFDAEHENVDNTRLDKVCDLAMLTEYISSLPESYNTRVGERGMMLSGGERQRIGIARALYKNASLVIFDESTNALDKVTHQKIIANIFDHYKQAIIIFISHQKISNQYCNKIIQIQNKTTHVSVKK